MKSQKGFTLIEVMVVVVIVAILASVAIPSYREYVIRGHRRAAQSAMMEIAARQHQYFVANRTFASVAELGYALPPELDPLYTFDITLSNGPPPGFTITFDAKGSQLSDGNLSLTSQGVKSPAGKW